MRRSSSSREHFSSPVSAETVTMARPPVGMAWLMVRMLAPQAAKIESKEERTPDLFLSIS